MITAQGKFAICMLKKDIWIYITDWISSPHIKKGNADNILTIEKKYEEMFFSINHEEVYRCAFMPFFGNNVGFSLEKNMSVLIDYLYMEVEM